VGRVTTLRIILTDKRCTSLDQSPSTKTDDKSSHKSSYRANYKPSLDEFISQCEVNYHLVIKLFPWLNISRNDLKADFAQKIVKFRPQSGHKIDLRLVEKAKYTTTMLLRVHSPSRSSDVNMNLMVRLYHDAQLLEVMDKIGPKALEPVNKGFALLTKQVDEKRQLNRFLGESLQYCLTS